MKGGLPLKAMPFGTGGEPYEVSTRTPIATYIIIGLNVIVYLITSGSNFLIATSSEWVDLLGFSPILLLVDPSQAYRIFSSMFVHADIFHIFFNMYFLYMFGRAVENTMGSMRYVLLYLLSGFLATVFHTVFSYLLGGVPALTIPAVGASGAISGILGAYMILYPGTRLSACFFFLIPFCFTSTAAAFLLFWFALQVVYGYTTIGAGIAFFAHAGGFVGGIALLLMLADKRRISLLRLIGQQARGFFGFIYALGYPLVRRGLSPTIKILFSALTIALVIGSATSYLYSSMEKQTIIVTKIEASLEGSPPISGYIVFRYANGELSPLGLELVPPQLRILVNRLFYSRLLYNPDLAGQLIHITEPRRVEAVFSVCGSMVRVPVIIKSLKGEYNLFGLLTNAEGIIVSNIVTITQRLSYCSYEIKQPPITMQFLVYSSERPSEITGLIAPQALLATITGLGALYVAVRRDEELVIVPS